MLSSGMSKATITSYMSSFGQCEKSVANYKLCETSLWHMANAEDVSYIYNQLFGIPEFYEYNKQQHNRFSAAFRKFIEYRFGENPAILRPLQSTRFVVEKCQQEVGRMTPYLFVTKNCLISSFRRDFVWNPRSI